MATANSTRPVAADSVNAFCTFRVDRLHFGIEVERVQEVLRGQRMTRVPGAHDVVRGLMNLRGQIVTALDMRRRLQLSTFAESPPSMNVVVRSAEGPVSLLVDEIGDVLQVSMDNFEPPPETLLGPVRGLIQGAYKLEARLLMILNIDAALRIAV